MWIMEKMREVLGWLCYHCGKEKEETAGQQELSEMREVARFSPMPDASFSNLPEDLVFLQCHTVTAISCPDLG